MRSMSKALAAATVLAGLGMAGAASAAPAGPVQQLAGPDILVERVADGCGPGFFRGRRGFCRPIGYGPRPFYGPRPYYGPPRFYGPRPYRPGFYGPRPFYGPRW